MDYEKGEPSVTFQNRPASNNSSVCSNFVTLYKRRRHEQKRRISRSPDGSSRYSLDDREFASKRRVMTAQKSAPRVSESDLCLNEDRQQKKKTVSAAGLTISSDVQRSNYGYHFDTVERENFKRCHSNRKEKPDGADRILGSKIRSMKEIQANGASTLKSIDLQLEIWKNLKSSHQVSNRREADDMSITKSSNSEQFSSGAVTYSDRMSSVNVRKSSRNACSVEELPTSGLEKKVSNQGCGYLEGVNKVGFKTKRFNTESSRHAPGYDHNKLHERDQPNVHCKSSCSSDIFFDKVDGSQMVTKDADLNMGTSYNESCRRKRRGRNSLDKHETQVQGRLCLDRNLTFVNSSSHFACDEKRARRYLNHETWTLPKKLLSSDYGNVNTSEGIQCEDKNFSYSQTSDEAIGITSNTGGEGKHLWEQTIIEESTASLDKSRDQSTYQEDEVGDDSSLHTSRLHNSTKKKHSWKRCDRPAVTHKMIPSVQKMCCSDQHSISDCKWENAVKQCSNSLHANDDVKSFYSQLDDSSQIPDLSHLTTSCGSSQSLGRFCLNTSCASSNVDVPNNATDDDTGDGALWTCTRWTDQIQKTNAEETTQPQWAYEMYSDVCQKNLSDTFSKECCRAIYQGSYTDTGNNFESDTRLPERNWESSSSYLNNYKTLRNEHLVKNCRKDPSITTTQPSVQKLSNSDEAYIKTSDESIKNDSVHVTSSNIRRDKSLEKFDCTLELEIDRYPKLESSSQDAYAKTDSFLAVETASCHTKLQPSGHVKQTNCPSLPNDVRGDKSTEGQNLNSGSQNVDQINSDGASSHQASTNEDIALKRRVHSIKEDIENVLQMLNSLEVNKDCTDYKTDLSPKRNILCKADSNCKLDAIANVNCATDYVKRAFKKLLSFKNKFIDKKDADDEESNEGSYEEYRKGKDDYMSNLESKEPTFDIEVIYPNKLVQTTSGTSLSDVNILKEEVSITEQWGASYQSVEKSESVNRCPASSQTDSPFMNDDKRRTRGRFNKKRMRQGGVKLHETELDSEDNGCMWQGEEESKGDTIASSTSEIRNGKLPVVVSNDLKHGHVDLSKQNMLESNRRTRTTSEKRKHGESLSPAKDKTLVCLRANNEHQLCASKKNMSSTDSDMISKQQKHQNNQTNTSTKTNRNEQIMNKVLHSDTNSLSVNKNKTLESGIIKQLKPTEIAESVFPTKNDKQGKTPCLSHTGSKTEDVKNVEQGNTPRLSHTESKAVDVKNVERGNTPCLSHTDNRTEDVKNVEQGNTPRLSHTESKAVDVRNVERGKTPCLSHTDNRTEDVKNVEQGNTPRLSHIESKAVDVKNVQRSNAPCLSHTDSIALDLKHVQRGNTPRISHTENRAVDVKYDQRSNTPRISHTDNKVVDVKNIQRGNTPRLSHTNNKVVDVKNAKRGNTPRLSHTENKAVDVKHVQRGKTPRLLHTENKVIDVRNVQRGNTPRRSHTENRAEDVKNVEHDNTPCLLRTDSKETDTLSPSTKTSNINQAKQRNSKTSLRGEDEVSPKPSKKAMIVSSAEGEHTTSPSVKTVRNLQIICKTIIKTPTPIASLDHMIDQQTEGQDEYSKTGEKSSPYEMSEAEMYINKYIFSDHETETETPDIYNKGQNTQIINSNKPETDVHEPNLNQRVKKTNRKKKSSRNKFSERQEGTVFYDRDTSKLSSSDTSLLRKSPPSRKGRTKRKKTQKPVDEEDNNDRVDGEDEDLPSIYNLEEKQKSLILTIPESHIGVQSQAKDGTRAAVDNSHNEISPDSVKADINHICDSNTLGNSNEKMACVLPDWKEHAILQRKHKNASSNTEEESKDTISRNITADISTSELNVSIKKLYEEINKLRMQLETSAEETVNRPLPVIERPDGSLQFARSYKAVSDFVPQTQAILDRRKAVEYLSSKSINSFLETIFTSGKTDVLAGGMCDKATVSTDSSNSQQRSALLKPVALFEVQDEHKEIRTNQEDKINDISNYNKSPANQKQEVPKDSILLSDLQKGSKGFVDNEKLGESSKSSHSEPPLWNVSGQENASCWPHDDVFVTAPCDTSEKSDTQCDITDKFDTAASDNEESINQSSTKAGDNNKPDKPIGCQSFERVTTCIKVQSKSELIVTRGPSPSKEHAIDSSLNQQVPVTIKEIREDNLSFSYSNENQIDCEADTRNLPNSINNNMRPSDSGVNPTMLKRYQKDVTTKQIPPHRYVVEKSVKTQRRSIAMNDASSSGDFKEEINYHEKCTSYFESSQKNKSNESVKICSQTDQQVPISNKQDTKGNDVSWDISPTCESWRNVSSRAQQNTSQNKGSPKEGPATENVSFQHSTADLKFEGTTENKKIAESMPTQVPILVQYVKDIFLGSTKVKPKPVSNKSVKQCAYETGYRLSHKEYPGIPTSMASRTDSTSSLNDISEKSINEYTGARMRGRRCQFKAEEIDTALANSPVRENYLSKKERPHDGHIPCSSSNFSESNIKDCCAIFDKEIVWKRQEHVKKQWTGKEVVVGCGLSKRDISLVTQNTPMNSRAELLSESYSSTPWHLVEPDKIMKHYSDAINSRSNKQFSYQPRESVTTVSRSHDSEICDSDLYEKDCLGMYEGLKKGDLQEKIFSSVKSDNRDHVESLRSSKYSSAGVSKQDDLISSSVHTSPDVNNIMASFENIMQQKRPYYVEHCGFRQKRGEPIIIDHCSHSQLSVRDFKAQQTPLDSVNVNFPMTGIANDNNSSIDLKPIKSNSNGYNKMQSNLQTDSYHCSDSDSDTFCFQASKSSCVSQEGQRNNYDDDRHPSETKSDDDTMINKYDDIELDDDDDADDTEEDADYDRELDEDVENIDDETSNQIELVSSSIDTDERESWYRSSDDESGNFCLSDDVDVENQEMYAEEETHQGVDNELEESEDIDDVYED